MFISSLAPSPISFSLSLSFFPFITQWSGFISWFVQDCLLLETPCPMLCGRGEAKGSDLTAQPKLHPNLLLIAVERSYYAGAFACLIDSSQYHTPNVFIKHLHSIWPIDLSWVGWGAELDPLNKPQASLQVLGDLLSLWEEAVLVLFVLVMRDFMHYFEVSILSSCSLQASSDPLLSGFGHFSTQAKQPSSLPPWAGTWLLTTL